MNLKEFIEIAKRDPSNQSLLDKYAFSDKEAKLIRRHSYRLPAEYWHAPAKPLRPALRLVEKRRDT